MTRSSSVSQVSLLLFAALHLAHLCNAERPSERLLDDQVVPPPKETFALRPAGALQALSRQNLTSSKKVTLSMLQEREHLEQVNAHSHDQKNPEDEDHKPEDNKPEDQDAVNEMQEAERRASHPDEDDEGDALTKRYEVTNDEHIAPGQNEDKAWTTMSAEKKYSEVDTAKLDAEPNLPENSKKITDTMGEENLHIDPELAVSPMYDSIREKLKRQEKMLTTNDFSIGGYRDKGEEALNKNKDYHEHLQSYVQGLYRMASGTQKLTRDTYVRHAGIATNLYNTVKDAKDYYKKPDDGIKATLLKEDAGYHLNAKHKATMKDFQDNHPDEDKPEDKPVDTPEDNPEHKPDEGEVVTDEETMKPEDPVTPATSNTDANTETRIIPHPTAGGGDHGSGDS